MMFKYFKSLLQGFPAHHIWAHWQHQQSQELMGKPPLFYARYIQNTSRITAVGIKKKCSHCISHRTKFSSVSLYFTDMHALQKMGTESTEDEPIITTEHLFVISPDEKHDHHSVHSCHQLLAKHLKKCGNIAARHIDRWL